MECSSLKKRKEAENSLTGPSQGELCIYEITAATNPGWRMQILSTLEQDFSGVRTFTSPSA